MPSHNETRSLPWQAEQMYALVVDVGRYGEFLPWVVAVRVRSDSETEMIADLIVGFKALRESFTSRVIKQRPSAITIDYLEGPLRYLRNDWAFEDQPSGGCTVSFAVDFQFRSKIFETIAGQMFDRALRRLIDAFIARAEALYGVPSGNNNSSATSAA